MSQSEKDKILKTMFSVINHGKTYPAYDADAWAQHIKDVKKLLELVPDAQ